MERIENRADADQTQAGHRGSDGAVAHLASRTARVRTDPQALPKEIARREALMSIGLDAARRPPSDSSGRQGARRGRAGGLASAKVAASSRRAPAGRKGKHAEAARRDASDLADEPEQSERSGAADLNAHRRASSMGVKLAIGAITLKPYLDPSTGLRHADRGRPGTILRFKFDRNDAGGGHRGRSRPFSAGPRSRMLADERPYAEDGATRVAAACRAKQTLRL